MLPPESSASAAHEALASLAVVLTASLSRVRLLLSRRLESPLDSALDGPLLISPEPNERRLEIDGGLLDGEAEEVSSWSCRRTSPASPTPSSA